MEKAKLIEAVKLLNATVYEDEGKDAKVPLLPVKIKFIAVKEADVQAAFIAACKSLIDTPLEEFVPQSVADAYNELVPEGSTAPAVEAKPEAARPKKAANAKDPNAPKKESNLPVREKDVYGNVVGTMSAAINAMLTKGAKKEDMIASLSKNFEKTIDVAKGKVNGHIKYLKEKGYDVTLNEKAGTYTLTAKK